MKLAWRAVALIGAGVALVAGCSIVTSYDGYVHEGPEARRFPGRPPPSGAKSGPELLGAMSSLRFLDRGDAGTLGYDLDGLCTTSSLDTRACTNAKAVDQTDLQGRCIDNAAGAILGNLYPPSADERLLESLRHGRNGVLIRVSDWDGTPNDSSVKVALFNVVGVEGDQDGGAPATFKGQDRFIIDKDSVYNEEDVVPKFVAPAAYVAEGVLVAPLDTFVFRIEVPNAQGTASVVFIPLSAATFIGAIARVGASGLRMNAAQLVGRLPVVQLFKQISGIGVCRDSRDFEGIKAQTCAALDLPLDPAARRSAPCDALSFAMGFSISPAQLGALASSPGVPSVCGEEPDETCR